MASLAPRNLPRSLRLCGSRSETPRRRVWSEPLNLVRGVFDLEVSFDGMLWHRWHPETCLDHSDFATLIRDPIRQAIAETFIGAALCLAKTPNLFQIS